VESSEFRSTSRDFTGLHEVPNGEKKKKHPYLNPNLLLRAKERNKRGQRLKRRREPRKDEEESRVLFKV
jgi:hypothetical protein